MDLLDVIIVAAVIGVGISGYRRGISWVSLSLLGLVVGLALGALAAPPIAHVLARRPQTEAILATGLFFSVVLIVQGVGTAMGYRARVASLRTRYARLDSGLGTALAALGVLAAAWYLGFVFAGSQWTPLAYQINSSLIERQLDRLAPQPPAFMARIAQIIKADNFSPFGIIQNKLAPINIPPEANTPGITDAAKVTSRVLAEGCGGTEAGSSWPLGTDLMVTNAHVVAGADQVTVQPPDGRSLRATVVLYDPHTDVAVLRVPGVNLGGLPILEDDAARGTAGAVIGYPNGGDETVAPAAVRGEESAEGPDIYGDPVTRDVEILAAEVIPGNSGGPVVDSGGRVIGLVFAASTTDPNEGYALTIRQISADLRAAAGRTAAVSTQDCTH